MSQPLKVSTTLAKAELSEPIQKSKQSSILLPSGKSQVSPPNLQFLLDALESISPVGPGCSMDSRGSLEGLMNEHITLATENFASDSVFDNASLIRGMTCAYSSPQRICKQSKGQKTEHVYTHFLHQKHKTSLSLALAYHYRLITVRRIIQQMLYAARHFYRSFPENEECWKNRCPAEEHKSHTIQDISHLQQRTQIKNKFILQLTGLDMFVRSEQHIQNQYAKLRLHQRSNYHKLCQP